MIFVCTGSVASFDKLIYNVDKLIKNKKIKEKIIMQIGYGKYIPKNCKWFRFDDNLDKYYKKSKLIISHAGAGIIYECLEKNKKLIVIENPSIKNKHQNQIAYKFSKEKYIIWCKKLEDLENCIKESKKFNYKKYDKPICNIHKKIEEVLK